MSKQTFEKNLRQGNKEKMSQVSPRTGRLIDNRLTEQQIALLTEFYVSPIRSYIDCLSDKALIIPPNTQKTIKNLSILTNSVNKRKVFCKNCKYRCPVGNFGNKEWIFCRYKNKRDKEQENDFTGQLHDTEKSFIEYKKKRNSTGQCEFYKRAWWKFWVKDNQ